jgi:hypothetical protein
MKRLFTERHGGTKPRVKEALDETSRNALWNLLAARIDEEWFGLLFPDKCCQDGYVGTGTDFDKLQRTMKGYGLLWPASQLAANSASTDAQILDVVEFAFEHISEPKDPSCHSVGHVHYSYDQDTGRAKFEHDVNRIFERNGIAFELKHGEVVRIAPTGLQEALAQTVFHTGDNALDQILEAARQKFLNRSLDVRRESLEKLWDAWERLKTIEPGKDKKAQAAALLAKGSNEPNFLVRLDKEAVELTEIGNTFMIRRSETDKIPIGESTHVDYLFHRMFSMIRLLLKASGQAACWPSPEGPDRSQPERG